MKFSSCSYTILYVREHCSLCLDLRLERQGGALISEYFQDEQVILGN